MANNPYVNKVVFGDEVLIDTSEVTVDETSLEAGKTALNAAGALITGTREFVSGVKGNAENTYRTGDVNLTPAQIGALENNKKLNCDITQSDNGLNNNLYYSFDVRDSNDKSIATVGVWVRPNGSTSLTLRANNTHNGGTVAYAGGIEISHYKDGTVDYSVIGPGNFRNAINAKAIQSAVSSPTASGTALEFIDSISQNTQGVITATKKSIDVIPINKGGTNETSIPNVLTNFGIALSISDTTWSNLYTNSLSKIRSNRTATVYITSVAASFMSGEKTLDTSYYGQIAKGNDDTGNYFVSITAVYGHTQYSWRISGLTTASSTPTISKVYKYEGTAI